MPKKKYKYDVAISFAGENRKIAEDLVASIKAKDKRLSVFYDKDHKAHLWGKNTNEFDNIYGPESRYVIPIISEHYTKKDWPRYEFSTAVKESKKRKGDFILPIRVDDTRLIGLHDDLNYMDIREDDVDQIAKAVILKCQSISKASPKKSGSKSPVLRGSSREALGIIATCIFPTELINFKKIFPHVKWDKELGLLSRKGLILRSSQSIKITQNVKNIFINDPRDSKEFNLAWIKALEPLKQYPDLSLMLAIHYMHLEKLDQAIVLAADMVVGMDYSWLNDIYLAFFRGLIQKGHSIKIEIETRLKLYNSIGLCLCHTGKYLEAAKWFLKLRRYSQEKKNKWGTGQSYINCGVAYQKSGDFKKAKYCYTQAIKHARACKDDLLLSHSLNNLAYLTSTDAYQQAEKLIA
ncbi:MAG TPA: toll/interleukin-1 receptor domain-containing protein, partial [Sedimentisphaerales bacterium]|nr:toll/interleukin-1 receptor domain-containing protein [Sedimentisphaerales bacterium]